VVDNAFKIACLFVFKIEVGIFSLNFELTKIRFPCQIFKKVLTTEKKCDENLKKAVCMGIPIKGHFITKNRCENPVPKVIKPAFYKKCH
jgi:hypothetical protein